MTNCFEKEIQEKRLCSNVNYIFMSTLGTTFYALGMGLLGGFAGNILAGWFNSIATVPSNDRKKLWIGIFIVFAMIVVISGMILGVS